jgi:hypothetical protein
MAQGLIAAALGGFGKALSGMGEMEAKKQNEAKLRKEIMAMESEERLRLDEITFGREMARAPIRATTQAKADVAGRAAKIDEENRLGVPEAEAKQTVTKNRLVTEQELKQNTPKLNAELKVRTRMAELAAGKENKLDEAEARAKYNAFMTDIKIAKELGADVAEAERLAEKENARLSALIKNRVPAKEAQLANERRLETVRAQLDSNIITEEANLLAKQEQAKLQAMTAEGVPEAEAKLLAAKWKAGKTQRDEAAAEKTQQEINDSITKAGNKKFMNAERTQAVNKRVVSDSGTPKEKITTADLRRKLDAAEDDLADALGVSDKKKVNEEIRLLTEMANNKKNPDPEAKQKLKDIEQLRANVKRRRDELQNWRDKPEEDKSGSNKKDSSNKRSLDSFNNK